MWCYESVPSKLSVQFSRDGIDGNTEVKFASVMPTARLIQDINTGGGVLSYMGYIDMCRSEGYGFQAVYSSIGYINQSVWV